MPWQATSVGCVWIWTFFVVQQAVYLVFFSSSFLMLLGSQFLSLSLSFFCLSFARSPISIRSSADTDPFSNARATVKDATTIKASKKGIV